MLYKKNKMNSNSPDSGNRSKSTASQQHKMKRMIGFRGRNRRIYVTHCSAKKDDTLKETNTEVTPDMLYKSTPIQRFMKSCKSKAVSWAIFSDKYGIWLSEDKHKWYEKDPNKVTDDEFNRLVDNFNKSLGNFGEIWFYHNPGRFHRLYKKLLDKTSLRAKIRLFTHIKDISSCLDH